MSKGLGGRNQPEGYFVCKVVSENRGLDVEATFQHKIFSLLLQRLYLSSRHLFWPFAVF